MAATLDTKSVMAEILSTQDEFFAARGAEFLALIRRVQQAHTREDYLLAQKDLLERQAGLQAGVRHARANLDADRRELSRLARLHPRPVSEIRGTQARIDARERKDLRNKVLIHILRCIADGLAWRALGYDRATFAVLGDGPRVGQLPDERGAGPERTRAQEWIDRGATVIFNDTTNCLRTGDLTILNQPGIGASVTVDEVKRSRRGRTRTRQQERLDRRLALLESGTDPAAGPGEIGRITRLQVAHEHYLETLACVLARTRREGYAHAQPHPALVVSAVDLRWATANQDLAGDWMTRRANELGWHPEDEQHFSGSALVNRMRERRHASSAVHAPIAIFPLCAEDILELLLGSIDYTVVLRVQALAPEFAARGIAVRFASGDEASRAFLRAHRDGASVTIPATLREQMLRELTSVDTVVAITDELLTRAARGEDHPQQLVLCDERSSWPPAPRYLAA
jgi:hypothetical protein